MARKLKQRYVPDYRLAWLLGVLGTAGFALGAWTATKGWQTRQWPRAEAEIIDASLARNERKAKDGTLEHRYSFTVNYRYSVDGQTFIGHGTEPYDLGIQNSAGARTMSEDYPVGAKVQVRYRPENPAEAYLMPGPSSFSLILLGLGGIFWLVALLARRMIRLGPGEDEDSESKLEPPSVRSPTLDPTIASYYEKSDNGTPSRPPSSRSSLK